MQNPNERQVGGDHYKGVKTEHWDLIEEHGIGYLEGCATKYLMRWRKKNGLEDLEKARHYIEKLISMHQIGARKPRGHVPMHVVAMFTADYNIPKAESDIIFCLTGEWTIRGLQQCLEVIDDLIKENQATFGRRFRVGDRVDYVGKAHGHIGRHGAVSALLGRDRVAVKFDDGPEDYVVREDSLKRVK